MFSRLLLILLIVPMVELALLMMLADWTSWKVALSLVIVTAIVGAWMIHREGWRIIGRIRDQLRAGELPKDVLLDGLFVLIAGTLLLTPGMLTDLTGILLLIPFTRQYAKRWLVNWFRKRFRLRTYVNGQEVQSTSPDTLDGRVVDRREE